MKSENGSASWLFLDQQWVNLPQICRVKFTAPEGKLQAFVFMSDARCITVKDAAEIGDLEAYLESNRYD